jgi:hypothetical protein
MKWIFVICLGLFVLFVGTVQAGEIAYTVRPTELKIKPFSDAATLLTLPEHGKVEILMRQASWMQVKSAGTSGWVKLLSLRIGNEDAPKKGGDSGLGALFNVAATGSSGSTVTTGVRGLSEEKLKNASPNPKALKTMQDFAVTKKSAVGFAEAGKLKSRHVDYLSPSGKGAN